MQFDQSDLKTEEVKKAFAAVERELEAAMQKFPSFPADPIHAVSVMNEESGEAIRAALQWTYENGWVQAVATELIQTAAMCIRCLCGIESGDIKPAGTHKKGYPTLEK